LSVAPKFHTSGTLHTRLSSAGEHPSPAGTYLLAAFSNLQHGFRYDRERPEVGVLLAVISRDAPDPESMSIGEKHFRAREPWFAIRINESVCDYLSLPTTSPIEYVRVAAEMYVLACAAVKAEIPPPMQHFLDLTDLRKRLTAEAEKLGWRVVDSN
jgi:hypothetical protein